jgi:glycosyltransferase involved in cell wall biosynthesis
VKPLVSILIPAYNAQGSIRQTLESALAQTWPRKEIIVVDDGSKDGTLAEARSVASGPVKVVSQANQGAAAARNKALSLAQGEYIQWLDADDLLSANKIAAQMEVLDAEGPRVLASAGWGYFRHRPSAARFVSTPLWTDLTPLEWMQRKWEHNLHMQTATWLASRSLLEGAGPWNTQLLGDDDGEYFSRVIARSERIRFAPSARVYYRISSAARLSYIGASNRKLDAQYHGMEMQIGYLRALDDGPRTRNACVEYLRTWLGHFHPNRPDIVARAQELARQLGGELELPRLSWKYDWIRRTLGWQAAKMMQIRYNERKSQALSAWDRLLFRLEGARVDMSSI